jgi:hypothetical protein
MRLINRWIEGFLKYQVGILNVGQTIKLANEKRAARKIALIFAIK